MALTNPSKLINVQELQYFEGKLAAKYQTQAITAIDGLTANNVEDALAEILGKVNALPSAIVPKGSKTFAQLSPSTDLVSGNVGYMWNITDSFTTTADFVEGAGNLIPAGSNIYVANPSTGVYKYDVFAGMTDLSNYKTKQTAVADGDATTSGTALTFVDSVTQNANGEVTVHKKTVADVVASEGGTGGSNGLMTAAQAEKLGALPTNAALTESLGGKADKVTSATADNFAALDSNGNLKDSGHKHSDYKTKQTAVTNTAGAADKTLATLSQNANGEISYTLQTIQEASASQHGLMTAAHYSKLEAIGYAADSDIDEIFA